MRAAAFLLTLCAVLVIATSAPASTQRANKLIGYHVWLKLSADLPKGGTVHFLDHGGRCDEKKVLPWGLSHRMDGLKVQLFDAKRDGSCAFERSDAQYKIELRLADGATLWSYLNIVQKTLGLWVFISHCYGNGTLPCQGADQSFDINDMAKTLTVHVKLGPLPLGPAGFTYCAPEGETCKVSSKATVAYGAHGTFHYKAGVTGPIHCTNATFGDPAIGHGKACYIKHD